MSRRFSDLKVTGVGTSGTVGYSGKLKFTVVLQGRYQTNPGTVSPEFIFSELRLHDVPQHLLNALLQSFTSLSFEVETLSSPGSPGGASEEALLAEPQEDEVV